MNLSVSTGLGVGVVLGSTGEPCGSKSLVWLSKPAGASVGPVWPVTLGVRMRKAVSVAAKDTTASSFTTLMLPPGNYTSGGSGEWLLGTAVGEVKGPGMKAVLRRSKTA